MPKFLRARPPLDDSEARKIRRLAGARHAPADWSERARMVALSWDGLAVPAIAAGVGCHENTVRRWLHRFNAAGVDGLGDRPGAGRKRRITEAQRSAIIALARSEPPGRLDRDGAGELSADDARAVTLLGHKTAPAEEIDRRVSLRLKRQDILTSPEPPQVWSVMDEAVLRRPLGGRAVMRGQLERLAEAASLPQVTIQVVPFGGGGHAAAGGSFTILRFAEPELPDIVYIEQLTSALYLDRPEDVDHYREIMNELITQALTPDRTAQFLAEITREV